MLTKEKCLDVLNNKQINIDVEKIFQKCYSGYGEITDKEASIFIYYCTIYYINKILDDDIINKTNGSIVTNEEIKDGLSFDNTIAAMTTLKDSFKFEFSEDLIDILKEKNIISFFTIISIIGHEIFHIYQRQCISNNAIKLDCLLDALEFVNRNKDENFYIENYDILHFEVTAEIAGIHLGISFLEDIIGRKLHKDEEDYIKELFITNNSRQLDVFNYDKNIIKHLNFLIDSLGDYIKYNLDLLEKYTVLQTIYDKNGNIRCIEDIIKLIEILPELGYCTEKDINKLYKYVIKSLNYNNQNNQKKYSL